MIITPIHEDAATGHVAEAYASDRKRLGYVASYTKAMTLNPEAHEAFETLTRTIAAQMGLRRYELVTLAAAKACKSAHCRLAHGRKSLECFTEDELTALARDHHDAGLSDLDMAIMDFAAKVSTDSASITDADNLRLRELGLTDREIVDVALAAAVRNYYGRALHALVVDVDPGARELEPELLGALMKGL